MKKVIGGILLFGLIMSLPSFFEDLSKGMDPAVMLGQFIGMLLFGVLIYYLFLPNKEKEENVVIISKDNYTQDINDSERIKNTSDTRDLDGDIDEI